MAIMTRAQWNAKMAKLPPEDRSSYDDYVKVQEKKDADAKAAADAVAAAEAKAKKDAEAKAAADKAAADLKAKQDADAKAAADKAAIDAKAIADKAAADKAAADAAALAALPPAVQSLAAAIGQYTNTKSKEEKDAQIALPTPTPTPIPLPSATVIPIPTPLPSPTPNPAVTLLPFPTQTSTAAATAATAATTSETSTDPARAIQEAAWKKAMARIPKEDQVSFEEWYKNYKARQTSTPTTSVATTEPTTTNPVTTNPVTTNPTTTEPATSNVRPSGVPEAYVYNETTKTWEKPVQPEDDRANTYVWDDVRGWVKTPVTSVKNITGYKYTGSGKDRKRIAIYSDGTEGTPEDAPEEITNPTTTNPTTTEPVTTNPVTTEPVTTEPVTTEPTTTNPTTTNPQTTTPTTTTPTTTTPTTVTPTTPGPVTPVTDPALLEIINGLNQQIQDMQKLLDKPAQKVALSQITRRQANGVVQVVQLFSDGTEQIVDQYNDFSARDAALQMFQNTGLDQNFINSLVSSIDKVYADNIAPTDAQILNSIYTSDAYKTRFAANEDIRKRMADGKGRPGDRLLSPKEYLDTEIAYRTVMEEAGLPAGFYDQQDDLRNFISLGVSPGELSSRVNIAKDALTNADQAVVDSLKNYYGLNTNDMIAYLLDKDKAFDVINARFKYSTSELASQYESAQIGGAAVRAGLGASKNLAEEIQKSGKGQQSEAAFQAAAGEGQDYQRLVGLYGQTGTSEDLVREQLSLQGGAAVTQKKKKLASRERAKFQQTSSISRTSLASRNKDENL